MKSEVNKCLKRGSWITEDQKDIESKGYRPIGTKTVFKIKHEQDGSVRYKTRIVTLGYNMVPGIHFGNRFSPVAIHTSVRLVLGIGLYAMNLERKRVNLDGAKAQIPWVFESLKTALSA